MGRQTTALAWIGPQRVNFCGLCTRLCVPCRRILVALNDTESYPPDVFDRVGSVDLSPRAPGAAGAKPTGASDRRRPAVYTGEVSPRSRPATRRPDKTAQGGQGYEVNFENTPVTTVAKVVLGDILGVGYTIDPRVQGTISLASETAHPKADILFVLENALRLSNVVLVRETAGYRIVPLGDAIGSGNVDEVIRPGPSPATAFRSSRSNTFRANLDQAAGQFRNQTRRGPRRCRAKHAFHSRERGRTPGRDRNGPELRCRNGCRASRSGFFRSATAPRNRSSPNSKRSLIPAKAASAESRQIPVDRAA